MNVGKTIGLIFLSSIAILALFLAVLGYSSQIFFEADTYISSFEEHGLYSDIDEQIQEGMPVEGMINFSTQEIVNDNLREVLTYLRGEQDTLNLTVVFEIDDIVGGLEEELEELPICESEQELQQSFQAAMNEDLDGITCRPEGDMSDLFDLGTQELPEEFQEERIEINILEELNVEEGELEELQSAYSFLQIFWMGSALIGVLILAGIVLLSRKESSKGIHWVGYALFGAALVLFAFSALLQSMMSSLSVSPEGNIEQTFDLIIVDIIQAFLSGFNAPIIISGLIGLICIGLGLFLKFSRKEKNEE